MDLLLAKQSGRKDQKMKTLAIFVALTIVSPRLLEAIDPPFVEVLTIASGHRDIQSTTSSGATQSQAQGSIGISIDYHFFKPVEAPFEIQCFFVARNEASKKRYIFDIVRLSQTSQVSKLAVTSAPLLGGTTQWHSTPWDLITSSGNVYLGTTTVKTQTTGSKIEGWIVRFVDKKSVLCIYSNQSFLKEQAERSPDMLNQMADETKVTTLQPGLSSTPMPASAKAGTPSAATPASANVKPPNTAEPLNKAGLFVGKSWVSDAGTKWTFLKDGFGEKSFGNNKTSFSWRELEPAFIEIAGRDKADSPIRLWYVRFLSDSEAIYGTAKDNLKLGMHFK